MFQGSVGYTLRYSMNIFINNSFLRVAQTNKLIKKKHYIISFKQKITQPSPTHPPKNKFVFSTMSFYWPKPWPAVDGKVWIFHPCKWSHNSTHYRQGPILYSSRFPAPFNPHLCSMYASECLFWPRIYCSPPKSMWVSVWKITKLDTTIGFIFTQNCGVKHTFGGLKNMCPIESFFPTRVETNTLGFA